ncbi:hypothetical protein GLW08_03980 [Pontibacillus yanchengensis]|uniref:Uncharacterized protein n=2 Tax=Pontibacillus yanchengensis TaxID=462910 RepID=A0ACC7VEX9_9BACI|nr:plasmid pRiA4b ORF-3 family protein [Pontibacillus yanchengensis]MYL35139.1 hypothetical protein [Pontibacillus yanchengensis]MYL52494.1 hypothetical protein [Pontibacillus yanchengensis]
MIYQLKIKLEGEETSVWRRVEIPSNFTFQNLHNVIQSCFNWLDSHIHMFTILQNNEVPVKIGMSPGEDLFTVDYFEANERIDAWLTSPGETCTYQYDFGDDWVHTIELEETLELQPNMIYPRCTRVKGTAPEEDGRLTWEGSESIKDEKAYVDAINSKLLATFHEKEKSQEDINEELYENIVELKQRKPWKKISDHQVIAIENPSEWQEDFGQFSFCSILGKSGQEFGVAIYFGAQGLREMDKILKGQFEEEDTYEMQNLLVTFVDKEELTKRDYEEIKEQQLTFRGENQWPQLRSFLPTYHPWYVDEKEKKHVNYILSVLLELLRSDIDEKEIATKPPEYFAILEATGGFEVSTLIAHVEDVKYDHTLYLAQEEIEPLKFQKRLDEPMRLDQFFLPDPVQEENGVRPYYVEVTVFFAPEQQQMLDAQVHPALPPSHIQQFIKDQFMSLGVPNEVQVANKALYEMIKPLLEALGISHSYLSEDETMNVIKSEMKNQHYS